MKFRVDGQTGVGLKYDKKETVAMTVHRMKNEEIRKKLNVLNKSKLYFPN